MPLLLLVACARRGESVAAASECQLSQVNGSVIVKDVPSNVAPYADGVVSVGTRFEGSAGGAMAAFGTAGSWDPELIAALGHHVIELDDVSSLGDQAWAVGALASSGPIAVRWDGDAWVPAAVADPGPGEDGFAGVDMLSADQVWAVGRHQRGSGFETLIERWNGSAWTIVPSPDVGTISDQLNDVDATRASDAWAVGWYVQAQRYRPLVEHWDGSRWSVVPTPNPGGGDAFLSGVVATGPDDAWAVGWTARGDALTPLVEHWDGGSWRLVAGPSEVPDGSFAAVAATPTGIVAVGRALTPQSHPLVAELQGSAWSIVPTPVTDPAWLTGVTVDASNAIWTVGTVFPPNGLAGSLVLTGCPAS